MRRSVYLPLFLGVLLVTGGFKGCSKRSQAADSGNYFYIPAVRLQVPKLPDWSQDTSIAPLNDAERGVALQLVLSSAVPGSPRIQVFVEPAGERPTVLEEYLTRNLQEMGQQESSGQIRIDHVEQKRVSVGSHPAYRVRHEFTAGSGAGQLAFNQVSTFVVLENRGVAITALGRTELFHPQAATIERIMAGLKTDKDVTPSMDAVDLGKIGGQTGGGK